MVRDTPRDEVSLPEVSAACQAMFDAETDVLVGDAIILLSNDGLLRSAELLDSERFDAPIARTAEQLITGGITDWIDLRRQLHESFPTSLVDSVGQSYYEERQAAPSDNADEQYVVYLAQKKLGETHIARQRVSPPTILPSGVRRTAAMRRSDDSTISVPSDWCEA